MKDQVKAQKVEKYILYGLIVAAATYFIYLIQIRTNTFGGGDNFVHFRVSRYAFDYPKLFMDHWGKPIFTAVSAPFSYIGGYQGMQIFNLIGVLFSCLFVYKIGIKLNLQGGFIAPLIALSAPLYFLLTTTAMTECFCGFVLILGVYLFLYERYLLAAIVISLIPFARTEGFLFIGIFAFCLSLRKQWKSLPFLLAGFVFYGIIGLFHSGDFFWLITQNPYKGTANLYKHGEWNHYLMHSYEIFGITLTWLSMAGLAISLVYVFLKRIKWSTFFLLSGCAILYFAAHSVAWWLGIGGSLGLKRIVTVITPLMAVFALFSIDLVLHKIKWPVVRIIPILILGSFIIQTPFNRGIEKFDAGAEEKVYNKAILYLEEAELDQRFIIYPNAYVTFKMDLDPFNEDRSKEWVYNRNVPSAKFEKGSIFIWDSHLGPNEGGVLEEELEADKGLRLVHAVYPEHPFKVLGGRYFEIRIYEVL